MDQINTINEPKKSTFFDTFRNIVEQIFLREGSLLIEIPVIALTTKVGITKLNTSNNYTLERLDTNDFPKSKNTKPNLWTQKVMN